MGLQRFHASFIAFRCAQRVNRARSARSELCEHCYHFCFIKKAEQEQPAWDCRDSM